MTKEKESANVANLRKRVARCPTEPGVYRWLDAEKNLLYVGKAKNLRNRMQSYLVEGKKHSPWTQIMVRHIADFEVTVVRSELEALILESNLIKEYQPKYNIMLKDDKGYVYVRMTLHEPFPMVSVVRRMEQDNAKYFGPFSGSKNMHQMLEMLDGILHFHACTHSIEKLNSKKEESESEKKTPCLEYQIQQCNGLCVGAITEEEYRHRINEVVRFFKGHFVDVKAQAKAQMNVYAEQKKFERAALLRDAIRFIEQMEEKQVVSDTSGEDADIFGIALQSGKTQIVLLRERNGKVIDQLQFALKGEAETAHDVLEQFLPQYYSETQDIPKTIIVSEALESKEALELWFREKLKTATNIIVPERGKKSQLLEIAMRNAEEKVQQQFAAWEAEKKKVDGALQELRTVLALPEIPRRIEGYDISHLGGSETVASMVVFIHGKPKRDHYRSFNMKTVSDGVIDDYKSLSEALRRRLRYLIDDLKTSLKKYEDEGITFGRARKAEQKKIEEIITKNLTLSTENPQANGYLIARNKEDILGLGCIVEHSNKLLELLPVWVHEKFQKKNLHSLISRLLLSKIKKGKVYVIIDPASELEEYYGELGFKKINAAPEILQEKIHDLHAKKRELPPGIVLMYEAKQNKPDASFADRPDLLLIDGGKGQLSAVKKVLDEMKVEIPVASLAKREEEIFLPNQELSIRLPDGSEARFLLQRLRDEAHRFANDRRERRATTALFRSKLDDIPSIGPETKNQLLKAFGSADVAIAQDDAVLQTILSAKQLHELRSKFPR